MPEQGIARIVVGALSGAPQLLSELSARVAKEGLLAADHDSIRQALDVVAPGKTAAERQLIETVVQRCLQQALAD